MNHEGRTEQELEKENEILKESIRQLAAKPAEMGRAGGLPGYREARNESVLEKLADIVWLLDEDFRIRYISPAVERVLGYAPREYLALPVDKRIAPASLKTAREALRGEMEIERRGGGTPDRMTTLEVEMYHQDGATRWLEFILVGARDSQGTLTGICGVSRDITKRRRAEEELQQTRDNFRRSLDESPLGVRVVGDDGETLYANRALLDFYGYRDIEEFRNTPVRMRYTPESYAAHERRREDRKRGEREYFRYDISIVRKDGEVRHLEVFRKPILWDGGWRYQATYQDITERKRMEEALRKREEYFRELVENISDIIVTMDKGGTITYVSPSVERIAGYRPDELVGASFLDFFITDDLPGAFGEFSRAMAGRDAVFPINFRIGHKNGAVLDMEGVCKNLLHNPAIASFVANIRDVTEKRRTEKERAGLEAKLRLAQKMEAIGALASGVAHDFNNLLAGIQGHVTMCLLQSERTHGNYERLKRIGEIVDSGANLTSQLLGFSRERQREVRPSNMNELIERTLMMFGRTRKEISIWRHCAEDLWAVEIDRGQMEQVIMNLLVNAWQAMPLPGEIVLETKNVFFADQPALPGIVAPGRYVKISVKDNGVGMDRETRERIFDPFFTTKERDGGSGLGLTTAYGIVKGHNGVIDVMSEPGRGTTFDIYLPATEGPIEQSRQVDAELLPGTETILLVDDEAVNLEVTGDLLEIMGYKVYKAGSGQEAVAVYMEKGDEIALVILDMVMPGISGGETLELLKGINPDLPVILCSGYSNNNQVEQLMSRGCKDFLQKPFHAEDLSRKLREILS
ncbi:MAG: PAS domain S-box protein [Pseudomonadota bacterium]|nr:PAS domain S-box protein [Pseudomonadota bacterium]